jgi:signal recognition particle GTPase
MAVLGFSDDAGDIVSLRKAIFRMILSRAKSHLADPSDIHELNVSQAMEGISFELLAADQSARLVEAVYQGTQDLKKEIAEGETTEEPVRPGIEEKLDEILALLSRFRHRDSESKDYRG